MTRVIIVGAGGHGRVVADIMRQAAQHGGATPVAFVDDDPVLIGTRILDLSVVGALDALHQTPHDAIVVAVGDNARRQSLSERFAAAGERLASVIHPFSSIGAEVRIGAGVMISAGVVVVAGADIGDGALLNTRSSVDHQSRIGPFAHVSPGATVGANVVIGERALIGTGASVMFGRSVGRDAVVGAGALVTRDVPARAVVVGVPARAQARRSADL